MRLLGATAEETQKVVEHWDQFDDDWTPQAQARFLTANDREIEAMLRAVREEYPFEPEHPPYVMDEAPDAVVMGVESPPEPPKAHDTDPMPENATIPRLEEWVGNDRDRAREVLEAERASDKPRSTLISRMEGIVDGSGQLPV